MASSPNASGKTRDEIAAAYKSEPWWYDVRGFFILTFAYNSTLGQQLRFFGKNFGPQHLEVACGTGTLLEMVLRWRKWHGLPKVQVSGIDYAESMLAGAIHRFRKQPDLVFQHADAAQLPFEDAAFDTANIANSVHCFPDVAGAFRGIFRVLKPGGTLAANALLYPRGQGVLAKVATRINDWGMKKGILYRPYHAQEVRELLLAAGFEVVSDQVSGNCLNILVRRPPNA
jgi:ubiquinone/menaquinone biosynthesis C-methylase UbiE